MANVLLLLPIFFTATGWLSLLAYLAPAIPTSEVPIMQFPTSFDDVLKLSKMLVSYYTNNTSYMFCLFICAYLYKQAFCIPGSAVLNILGGAIFGFWTALPLCCFLTGVGATLSYLLSKVFAKYLVMKIWANEVNTIREKIERNGEKMFFYLLSLRLMPISPNWLLNLVSPIVGVPLHLFFSTVFLGLIPYNYICVQAGSMIAGLSSFDEIFTWKIMFQLVIMAVITFIIPYFIKPRSKT